MTKLTRTKQLSLTLLVAAGAALLLAGEAAACSCAGPAKGEERAFYKQSLKRSDGAIVARVLSVETIDKDPELSGEEDAVYELRVRRAFKRLHQFPAGRILRIRTSASGAACGLEMREGQVDGLFLYRYRGRLGASLCSRVTPANLRRAARDRGLRTAGSTADCTAQAG